MLLYGDIFAVESLLFAGMTAFFSIAYVYCCTFNWLEWGIVKSALYVNESAQSNFFIHKCLFSLIDLIVEDRFCGFSSLINELFAVGWLFYKNSTFNEQVNQFLQWVKEGRTQYEGMIRFMLCGRSFARYKSHSNLFPKFGNVIWFC